MLEILIPVPVADSGLLQGCLDGLQTMTGVPFRTTIIIDGGRREDFLDVETWLAGSEMNWSLLHNEQPIYLNQSIAEVLSSLDKPHQPLTVLMGAHVRLTDERWIAKMKIVFDKDHRAAMVDTWPNTASTSVHPVKRTRHVTSQEPCRLVMLRTAFALANPPGGDVDPVTFWHNRAFEVGLNVWAADGVSYAVIDHKEHRLWPGQSQQRTTG